MLLSAAMLTLAFIAVILSIHNARVTASVASLLPPEDGSLETQAALLREHSLRLRLPPNSDPALFEVSLEEYKPVPQYTQGGWGVSVPPSDLGTSKSFQKLRELLEKNGYMLNSPFAETYINGMLTLGLLTQTVPVSPKASSPSPAPPK